MAVLQICRDRTGGFFVWKIIQTLCDIAGKPDNSFIKNHEFQSQANNWPDLPYNFFDVDHLSIWPWGCFADVDVLLRQVVVDVPAYVASCRHVMSESPYFVRHDEILPLFDSVVYLMRDPRDSLVSLSQFEFKPYRQRYGWTRCRTPSEYIEENLDEFFASWARHVEGFHAVSEAYGIYFLRYEDLLSQFEDTVQSLSLSLGLKQLDEDNVSKVRDAILLKTMKLQYPDHVQQGRAGRYRSELTREQNDRVLDICGSSLERFGYDVQPHHGLAVM